MTKPIDLEPAGLPEFIRGWTAPFQYTTDGIRDAKGCWIASATTPKLGRQLVELMNFAASRSAPEAGKAVDAEAALRSAKPIIEALIAKEYNVETWGLKSRLAAIEAALASAATEPVAWMFELANARNTETDEPCNWGKPQLSFTPPCAGKYQRNVTPLYSTLASPAPSGAEAVDGPEEIEIDRLRLAAFKTNTNEDKAAYYLAVSKWFQDRHYRRRAYLRGLPSWLGN